jgi:hypothetical protein
MSLASFLGLSAYLIIICKALGVGLGYSFNALHKQTMPRMAQWNRKKGGKYKNQETVLHPFQGLCFYK